MNPIGYWLKGITFLCVQCARFAPDALAVVYGACHDVKCAECKKTIPANRKYGKKGLKDLTRQPKGEDNGCI